jgi:hypothetical protein
MIKKGGNSDIKQKDFANFATIINSLRLIIKKLQI